MMQYNYLYDSMATRVVPDSWVVSQIWIDSDSNESSYSRDGRENQGYESRVSSLWSPFESELSELDTIESKLSHWLSWRETVKVLHLSTVLQRKNQPTVTIQPPPPPVNNFWPKLGISWWVVIHIWLNSDSSELSRSRVRLPNLEFELGRCRAKQEKWSVELSQSRITRIVTWVRVESARKIWVEHNPAGYRYYFPFTLFGIAQCSYLNRRSCCAPHQSGTPHLYYGPSALTPAMSPHASGAIPLSAPPPRFPTPAPTGPGWLPGPDRLHWMTLVGRPWQRLGRQTFPKFHLPPSPPPPPALVLRSLVGPPLSRASPLCAYRSRP